MDPIQERLISELIEHQREYEQGLISKERSDDLDYMSLQEAVNARIYEEIKEGNIGDAIGLWGHSWDLYFDRAESDLKWAWEELFGKSPKKDGSISE
jgi:hypothetical protein